MTIYKVRRGEAVTEVEGFAALVQMAQAGELGPDDAVFVPASNRWHYARSIRQLREHFPQVEDPPPPAGKIREMPREKPRDEPVQDDGTEATHVAEGNGGDLVPMRRGRWSPEGKGVEVSVFNYEMDLEPPKAAKPLRLILVTAFALAVGGTFYLYVTTKSAFQLAVADGVERGPVSAPTPVPRASARPGTRVPETPLSMATAPPPPPATEVAVAVATPEPLPEFDSGAALEKVRSAGLTSVQRPDQLAAAIKGDLIKLAVPVRRVELVPGKAGKTKGPVPFDLVVDYSLGDETTRATHARHYWMIAAMVGRRATELKLNLRAVSVRSFSGNKTASKAELPAELVKGVANGSIGSDALLGKFPDLVRP